MKPPNRFQGTPYRVRSKKKHMSKSELLNDNDFKVDSLINPIFHRCDSETKILLRWAIPSIFRKSPTFNGLTDIILYESSIPVAYDICSGDFGAVFLFGRWRFFQETGFPCIDASDGYALISTPVFGYITTISVESTAQFYLSTEPSYDSTEYDYPAADYEHIVNILTPEDDSDAAESVDDHDAAESVDDYDDTMDLRLATADDLSPLFTQLKRNGEWICTAQSLNHRYPIFKLENLRDTKFSRHDHMYPDKTYITGTIKALVLVLDKS